MNETISNPEEMFAAALDSLAAGGDYRPAYHALLELYRASALRTAALEVLTQAFYAPNEGDARTLYRRNCRLLARYPYIFRRDFPDFDELTLRFYPYDDLHWYPFDGTAFGEPVFPRDAVISRNFFAELDRPVLATDVYSQYELEYLADNVRSSEDVGRDNHIYLHYSRWEAFCAWLQILDIRPLLAKKKAVFLFEQELERYPLDFAACFGTDYSQYTPRPIGIRDVHRLIWHVQLSAHNGGDFFNEIFDSHPNLLLRSSVFLEDTEKYIALIREGLQRAKTLEQAQQVFAAWENPALVSELFALKNPTDKDLVVAFHLSQKDWNAALDQNARISPAIFLQPHFHAISYRLRPAENGVVLESAQAESIESSPVFRGFKYIKAFTPLRRFTTSYAAAVRFMVHAGRPEMLRAGTAAPLLDNAITRRVYNRSFMADPDSRLLHDSAVVRLEDGKLNPKATFTALAAFLDLPYTESMTYCSEMGEVNPHADWQDYAVGFDLRSVYNTYDEYADAAEKAFIEYCFRDAYACYGYDFQYYHGQSMEELVSQCHTLERLVRADWESAGQAVTLQRDGRTLFVGPSSPASEREQVLEERLEAYREEQLLAGRVLSLPLRFVNRKGAPLKMQPLLQLDPGLMETERYH